jgi:hypothetical protein
MSTESRRMRRAWVRAYRRVQWTRPAARADTYRRAGLEHISGPLRRVLEGLARLEAARGERER